MNSPTVQFAAYADERHKQDEGRKCPKCGRADGDSTVRLIGGFGFVFVTFWLADMLPTVNEKAHVHPADGGMFATGLDIALHSWPLLVLVASVLMITPKGFDKLAVLVGSFRRKRNGGT